MQTFSCRYAENVVYFCRNQNERYINRKRTLFIGLCLLFVVGIVTIVKADVLSSRLKTSSQEEGKISWECRQAEGFCLRNKIPVKGIYYVQE